MTAPACLACRFFARHTRHDRDVGGDINLATGDCRRQAPRARMTRDGTPLPAAWPQVDKGAFCGEFQQRIEDTPRPETRETPS